MEFSGTKLSSTAERVPQVPLLAWLAARQLMKRYHSDYFFFWLTPKILRALKTVLGNTGNSNI